MSRQSIIFLLTLFFFIQAKSQDKEAQAPAVQVDTVVATDAPMVTEDEDEKSSFDTVSAAAPVTIRTIPDSTVRRLQQSDEYWYAALAPERDKQGAPEKNQGFQPPSWVRKLLWLILLGGFVALVAWFLWTSKASLFQNKSRALATETFLEEDIHAIDFEKEKKKAEAGGDYRLATRLWFLQTLKLLADKEVIRYSQEKTNSDYLSQLQGTKAYDDFFRLTRTFEYTWYGQFQLSEEAYQRTAQLFSIFHQQV